MKAIVISKWFPTPYVSNSGVFVLEQIKALRRQGIDVVLVIAPTPWAPRWLRFLPRVRKYKGIPQKSVQAGFHVEHPRVVNFPADRLFFLYGMFFYLRCRPIIRRLLKEQSADLVHAHTVMPEGFAAVLLAREFGLPAVCTIHGGDINNLLPPFLLASKRRLALAAVKWSLRHLKHLITVSGDLKRKVEQLVGGQGPDITIAQNGADTEFFKPMDKNEARKILGLPSAKRIVVFVGGLVYDKGIPFLLDAFARVSKPDTALYLIGDGVKKEALQRQCRALKIENQCVFAGRRPHEEIPLWLSSCDCFVLSSVTEGSPTIIAEAMLCRVPIVATAVGGVPELISNGETGLIVPSKDSAALARAIDFMLTNHNAAEQMAHRAEIHAKTNLTWDANARKTIQVYRAAANNRDLDVTVKVDLLEQKLN